MKFVCCGALFPFRRRTFFFQKFLFVQFLSLQSIGISASSIQQELVFLFAASKLRGAKTQMAALHFWCVLYRCLPRFLGCLIKVAADIDVD